MIDRMRAAPAFAEDQSVLIVEAPSPLASRHADRLKAGGFAVTEVRSSAEALKRLGHERFDVVVVDTSSPGSAGLALLKRLRQRGVTSSVIVLLERAANSLLVEAMGAGAQQCLVKPVAPEVLLEAVRVTARRLFRAVRSTPWYVAERREPAQFAVSATAGVRLDRLTRDFDALLAKMQTAGARRGMRKAFQAGPGDLGRAAISAARERG